MLSSSGLWTAAKQFALSLPVAVAFNDLGAAPARPARPRVFSLLPCPVSLGVPARRLPN